MSGARGLRALVSPPVNGAVTIACLLLLAWVVPPLLHWAVLDAVWSGGPEACQATAGACWTYVGQKLAFFVFGFYPSEARWRPFAVLLLLVALLGGSLMPRLWTRKLLLAWPLTLCLVLWVLGGGLILTPVPPEVWGGLPLTILIASFALVLGFPLGVLLALGRTSSLPFFRVTCTAFIELLRGLPLVSVLFMAIVMVPLLVPAGVTPGKLLRAYLAFTLVASAFIAEIVRGGLQAVPSGQQEAATALGLGYWRTMWLVVLPQCLRACVPSLVGVAISLFKDTSLVTVIGLTDLLGAVGAGARDAAWLGHDVEGYVFAAVVYFTFCFTASRYAAWLERRLGNAARMPRAAVIKQASSGVALAARPEASIA
jgi:general L-amino acid transport system permease protein